MNKREAKDPYATLCLSRLTRTLDLDVLETFQSLEQSCFVMKNLAVEELSKPHRGFIAKSSDRLNKLVHRKGHRVFGHSLTAEGLQRIAPLMDYLKLNIDKEGLFRISGSKKRQEDLKELVDKDIFIDLESGKFTAHDVATVLKQFLAELPEPLLTPELHHAFLQVAERGKDRSKNIEALQLLFLLLPPISRQLLQLLLTLLNAVAQNPQNKMTAHNLSVIFSPNIMHVKKQRVTCLSQISEDMNSMNSTIACMIMEAGEVFKIPDDLKEEIELTSSRLKRGEDGEVPMRRTFCKQIDNRSHRISVQKSTTDALLQLYGDVMQMPDGPVKQNFLEKFGKCYPGTPPFMPGSHKGKSRVQTSTPLDHGGSSRLLTRTPLSPVNQQRMMSLTKKVLLGTGADHTGAAPHQTPTGTLGRRAHKRMPGSSDQSAMQHKRPKQLVIDTPSGCLDSWQPCQTPDSQSDSGSEVWSSTPVERYPCRGLLHPPSVSDLSFEVYSV